jgi:hypothetical protein
MLSCGERFVSTGGEGMGRAGELAVVPRAYAKHVLGAVGASSRRVEAAFAAVPREHFLYPVIGKSCARVAVT